jgi:catechol 2,3-dioxygenase-like lactoylglutathione lyase family enzyme
MTHRGFSHIGLSTLDLDKTREFYEGVLGFKPVVADTITIEEGGRLRHLFFDIGGDQLIAFLEPQGVPGIPADYDAGINRGLGVPAGFYHFAFEAGSPAALARKRDELRAKKVEGHQHRRPPMGPVDLLQRFEWPVARILLRGRQPSGG